MNKPVELIVANAVHDIASRTTALPPELIALAAGAENRDPVAEACARHLLCALAHDAALPVILRALAATGAPATIADLAQRLTAVRDAARNQAGAPPLTAGSPQGSREGPTS